MSCCERAAADVGGLFVFQILVYLLVSLSTVSTRLESNIFIYLFTRLCFHVEVRYRKKAPPQLVPLDLTPRGFRMQMNKKRRLTNWRVSYVCRGEAIKVKEFGKGEEQVKYNPASEGD